MMRQNYQKELDRLLESLEQQNRVPSLLMHSCCAPCSSYCLSYLAEYFYITVFYYNPNIAPEEEYRKRVREQMRLIRELETKYPISFAEGEYEPEIFYQMAKGLEQLEEGGSRCFLCYELRQRKAAEYAKAHEFDFFTTTLSVSPHKNADKLNEIGRMLSGEYEIPYLFSDFKKRGGYQKSIELSRQFGLYRQDYCGCEFSKRERFKKKAEA